MEKLKKLINDKGVKLGRIASVLEISRYSLWRKMTGKSHFKNEELHRIADFLNVPFEELTND